VAVVEPKTRSQELIEGVAQAKPYDGKHCFTIYEFVGAHQRSLDPEWDGEPMVPELLFGKLPEPGSSAMKRPSAASKPEAAFSGASPSSVFLLGLPAKVGFALFPGSG
jgi:hypothetical protein